nr:hypothetical protein [Pseudonocardia sp. ICBG1142]
MPTSAATARAQAGWSPVSITTRTPARRAAATASAAPGRGGSDSATSPARTRSRSASPTVAGTCGAGLLATAITRRPRAASTATRPAVSGDGAAHRASTDSGEPVVTTVAVPEGPAGRTTVIVSRPGSNGNRATGSAGVGRPRSRAATRNATSVGSPDQPPSGSGAVSVQAAPRATTVSPSVPGAGSTRATAIRLRVSVPVLSVASTVTSPSASAARSRRTSPRRRDSRCAPSPSTRLTMIGSSSGTVAKARVSPVSTISRHGRPVSTPISGTSTLNAIASVARLPASSRMACCSAVRGGRPATTSPVSVPSSVAVPVATTTPRARPATTVVPANTRFVRSASAASPGSTLAASLGAATGSPVRVDSSTRSPQDSTRRRSAGTREPAASGTRSPGTTSVTSTETVLPSRTTGVVGAVSSPSEAMTDFARNSANTSTPTTAAMITTTATVSSNLPQTP